MWTTEFISFSSSKLETWLEGRERLIYHRCTPLRTNGRLVQPFARSRSTWKTLYLLCFCDIDLFVISSFIGIINFSWIFFFNLWITSKKKKDRKRRDIYYTVNRKHRKFFDRVTHRWVMTTMQTPLVKSKHNPTCSWIEIETHLIFLYRITATNKSIFSWGVT